MKRLSVLLDLLRNPERKAPAEEVLEARQQAVAERLRKQEELRRRRLQDRVDAYRDR